MQPVNTKNTMQHIEYFYCYSARLRRFIYENNIKWVRKGLNPKSGYPYWVFERSEELGKLLMRYNKEN